MSVLAVSNLHYALESWTPGGALLGVGILAAIGVIWRKISG